MSSIISKSFPQPVSLNEPKCLSITCPSDHIDSMPASLASGNSLSNSESTAYQKYWSTSIKRSISDPMIYTRKEDVETCTEREPAKRTSLSLSLSPQVRKEFFDEIRAIIGKEGSIFSHIDESKIPQSLESCLLDRFLYTYLEEFTNFNYNIQIKILSVLFKRILKV